MSAYAVMRTEKRKIQACRGIGEENNRKAQDRNKPLFENRQDEIQWDKTDSNISIVSADNLRTRTMKELKDHGIDKLPRKDSVAMLDTVYTASPEAFEKGGGLDTREKQVAYFEECLSFHEKKYGHVINAVIHFDETSPHLHVCSTPLEQTEQGTFKLNAKGIIGNSSKMSHTQSEFFDEVASHYNLERGEIHGKGKRKHKDQAIWRMEQLEQTNKQLLDNNIELGATNKRLKADNERLQCDNDVLTQDISDLQTKYDEAKEEIASTKEELERVRAWVVDTQNVPEKSLGGKTYKVPINDYKELVTLSNADKSLKEREDDIKSMEYSLKRKEADLSAQESKLSDKAQVLDKKLELAENYESIAINKYNQNLNIMDKIEDSLIKAIDRLHISDKAKELIKSTIDKALNQLDDRIRPDSLELDDLEDLER